MILASKSHVIICYNLRYLLQKTQSYGYSAYYNWEHKKSDGNHS